MAFEATANKTNSYTRTKAISKKCYVFAEVVSIAWNNTQYTLRRIQYSCKKTIYLWILGTWNGPWIANYFMFTISHTNIINSTKTPNTFWLNIEWRQQQQQQQHQFRKSVTRAPVYRLDSLNVLFIWRLAVAFVFSARYYYQCDLYRKNEKKKCKHQIPNFLWANIQHWTCNNRIEFIERQLISKVIILCQFICVVGSIKFLIMKRKSATKYRNSPRRVSNGYNDVAKNQFMVTEWTTLNATGYSSKQQQWKLQHLMIKTTKAELLPTIPSLPRKQRQRNKF